MNRERAGPRRDRGFVAIEFVAAVAFLLLPVVLFVASLPTWAERQHAGTVAAREAVRVAVRGYPDGSESTASEAARLVAVNYGIPADDVNVVFTRFEMRRGGVVTARVTVAMPAIAIPGMRTAGGWEWTATQSRRIDDYRSR